MSLKQEFIKYMPHSILRALRFIKKSPNTFVESFIDIKRYLTYSSAIDYRDDSQKLLALITATYHNIEKGLSLPNPRPGFGMANINKLIGLIEEYHDLFGFNRALQVPLSVLEKYCEFNKLHNIYNNDLTHRIASLRNHEIGESEVVGSLGGVIPRSKIEILNITSKVPVEFFYVRHSVRQFSDEPVDIQLIEQAVKIAQKSPVVCNRQSGKVYTIIEKDIIEKALEIQAGARGFGDNVQVLFCITADLRNFHGSGERYQGWIDGGMFAMSFIYGLHQQGLGSCCLNWSKNHEKDKEMKAYLNIPDSELIIMFVASGHLKDHFYVAKSERKAIEDVHTILDKTSVNNRNNAI